MNGLTKIILVALLLILIVLALSQYQQNSKRRYSKRLQLQMKLIQKDLNEHVKNAVALELSHPMASFQQACYAATEIDDLKRLAPEEDLQKLLGTSLDQECAQMQGIQARLWKSHRLT